MDLARIKQLAGFIPESNTPAVVLGMLNESTVIDETMSLEQIASMMDAARRGLGMANRLTDPVMKRKHVRAIFINMNKIRAALARALRDMNVTDVEGLE